MTVVESSIEPILKDAAWWTEWHLWNWALWMNAGELPDGVPCEACGGAENYTTYDANSERAYTALDAWSAETTHMVVQGLDASERMAVHRCYLDAVYRFVRGNYEEILARARANAQAGLRRRGVWLGE